MTSHIRIPATPPSIHYTGDGIQKNFTYPFPVFSPEQMVVSVNRTIVTTGYSVTGTGQTTGGSVIFDTAPALNAIITLERRMIIERTSDFIEGGELSANALNNEFDRSTAIMQQLDYDAAHALSFSHQEPKPPATLPPRAQRAEKVLGFDTSGNIMMYDVDGVSTPPVYTQSGNGAVTRLLAEKAHESVSVMDFGAAGDGIEDDSAAIRMALDAHDCVYFPTGTYRLASTLTLEDNKRLYGDGRTSILVADNNSYDLLEITGSHCHVSDLMLESGETGIRLYGAASPCCYNSLSGLVLRGQSVALELDGYIDPVNPCAHNTAHHLVIENPASYGILVTRSGAGAYPENNLFTDIRLEHSAVTPLDAAFYIEAGRTHNRLIHCSTAFTTSPACVVRIGAESRHTHLGDLHNTTPINGTGILLENGSQHTSLHRIHMNTSGTIIDDLSGCSYSLLQPQDNLPGYLDRLDIDDFSVAHIRHKINMIVPVGYNTELVDLTYSIHMIDTVNGPVTMQLPKATAHNSGAYLFFKKVDSSSHMITLVEQGGTGPDGYRLRLGVQNGYVGIVSDGACWRIIQCNIPSLNSIYISGVTTYAPDISIPVHIVNPNAGILTVELPPGAASESFGKELTIKKYGGSTHNVRITEAGAAGPDGQVATLSTNNTAITVMCNGGGWFVTSRA